MREDGFDRGEGEVVVEAAVGCDGDELEAGESEGAAGEAEVLSDAEVVEVGAGGGGDGLGFVEVVLRGGVEEVEVGVGEAGFAAGVEPFVESAVRVVFDALQPGAGELRGGVMDAELAAGEVEGAEAEVIEEVDGLHEAVGPVDDGGV
ncbi:MAG: hypothetical protein IT428_24740 [Planctomycetaceae bacterium]|nr:hypothetical protein [Planctomycetaceae bacterium]